MQLIHFLALKFSYWELYYYLLPIAAFKLGFSKYFKLNQISVENKWLRLIEGELRLS